MAVALRLCFPLHQPLERIPPQLVQCFKEGQRIILKPELLGEVCSPAVTETLAKLQGESHNCPLEELQDAIDIPCGSFLVVVEFCIPSLEQHNGGRASFSVVAIAERTRAPGASLPADMKVVLVDDHSNKAHDIFEDVHYYVFHCCQKAKAFSRNEFYKQDDQCVGRKLGKRVEDASTPISLIFWRSFSKAQGLEELIRVGLFSIPFHKRYKEKEAFMTESTFGKVMAIIEAACIDAIVGGDDVDPDPLSAATIALALMRMKYLEILTENVDDKYPWIAVEVEAVKCSVDRYYNHKPFFNSEQFAAFSHYYHKAVFKYSKHHLRQCLEQSASNDCAAKSAHVLGMLNALRSAVLTCFEFTTLWNPRRDLRHHIDQYLYHFEFWGGPKEYINTLKGLKDQVVKDSESVPSTHLGTLNYRRKDRIENGKPAKDDIPLEVFVEKGFSEELHASFKAWVKQSKTAATTMISHDQAMQDRLESVKGWVDENSKSSTGIPSCTKTRDECSTDQEPTPTESSVTFGSNKSAKYRPDDEEEKSE